MSFSGLGDKLDNKAIFPAWTLQVTDCRPLTDYEDKNKVLGTRLTVAIVNDAVTYSPRPDGRKVTNIFEKFTVKIIDKKIDVPVGSTVELVNPRGKVYGNFAAEFNAIADDVKIVNPGKS